jgi:dolichol kinase
MPPSAAGRPGLLAEIRRKAIHLAFIVMPLQMVFPILPWPRTAGQFRTFLLGLGIAALGIDLLRQHHRHVAIWFKRWFGEMIREHEEFSLLGSSYIVLGALIALIAFPMPVAAAALGFTIFGDAVAAIVGRACGRTRLFNKSLEGALAGLAACLLWGAVVAAGGALPWRVAAGGALVASLIEILPIPLDDNLGITLSSGLTMAWLLSTV